MNLTTRRLIAVIYLINYGILTLAQNATIVGYVGTNTTLVCDIEFYNYPAWLGPYGTTLTYTNYSSINPAYDRLIRARNRRDLIIRYTNKADAGDYTCYAPHSSAYRIQLVVRVPPDRPEIQNIVWSTMRGIEDETVTLTCISRGGFPAPYLDWYMGSTKLTSTRTETEQADGTTTVTITFSFKATRSLDKTNYICKSSFDPPDSPLASYVRLFLSLKPSFPVINGTSMVSENNSVHLQCMSTGCRPEGNMSWTFDGQTIVTNTQNTQVSDTFTITSDFLSRTLRRADNRKSVMCRVGHESLTSYRAIRQNLTVWFPPSSVSLTGNRQTIANGQNKLTLTCTTDSAYPTAIVTWWNGLSKITIGTSQATLSGNYGGTITAGRLEIQPTRAMDGDSISCRGYNSAGPSNSIMDQVVLNLMYSPLVTILGTSPKIVTEGDSKVVLHCSANSKPTSSFTWYKDNVQLASGTAQKNMYNYTINNVDRSHYGFYRCQASNGISPMDGKTIQLQIKFAPTSVSLTGNQPIIANGQNKLTLTCTTDSAYPTATVTWWNGSSQISVGTSQTTYSGNYGGRNTAGKLEIRPTRAMDGDVISCRGSNSHGPSNPLVDQTVLNLKYSPLVTISGTSPKIVKEGDSKVVLHCSANSKPTSSFIWYKGNTQLASGTAQENTCNYTINNVARSHYGIYRCQASNGISPMDEKTIQLQIKFAPTSVSLTGNQPIIANGQNKLTLTCTTDSAYPTATVTWWNGSSQITVGTSQTTYSGNYGGRITTGRLEIKPTRAMDDDSISCRGYNSEGPSNHLLDKVVLNLMYAPITAIIGGSQRNVTEGDSDVSLDCTAKSKPPANFTWQRPGEANPTKTGTGTADNNRLVYTILLVSRYHAGVWRCTADNGIPTSDSSEQELIVYYPPDITVSTTNTTTSARDHYINCSASGFPSSYDFTTWMQKWSETGVIIREKLTSSGEISPSTQYLHFPSLSYQDTGVYMCGAENGVENVISTGTVYLLVKASPVVTKFSNVSHTENMIRKVQAFLNKRVSIHSTVYSNAGAVVTKIFKLLGNALIDVNGTSIKPVKTTAKLNVYSHVVDTDDAYELTIYHTIKTQEEFGIFVLYLTNDIGTTTLKFEITPEGPPETPKEFTAHQGSEKPSSISFTWFPGFHGDADQTFHIEYRSEGHDWKEGARVFGGKVLEQQLQTYVDGLESGSSYLFRIYASNKYGNSDKSQERLGRTVEGQTNPDGQESDDNTASVAGWSAAAILGILLTVIGLLFLLHRYDRLPFCRKTQKRTDTLEVAFSDLNTESKTETSLISSGTLASTLEGQDNDRNSGNVYDELDPEKGATHVYSMMHEDPADSNQRHENNQGSEKKTYANVSDSKIFRKHAVDSKEGMQGEGNTQAEMYSNLSLSRV